MRRRQRKAPGMREMDSASQGTAEKEKGASGKRVKKASRIKVKCSSTHIDRAQERQCAICA